MRRTGHGRTAGGLLVSFETSTGAEKIEVDQVLVAIGRRPVTEDAGLARIANWVCASLTYCSDATSDYAVTFYFRKSGQELRKRFTFIICSSASGANILCICTDTARALVWRSR